jgi:hypothetical protein
LCGILEAESFHQLARVDVEPVEDHHARSMPAELAVAPELYGPIISKDAVKFLRAAKLHRSLLQTFP